jgi:hypothetical protein
VIHGWLAFPDTDLQISDILPQIRPCAALRRLLMARWSYHFWLGGLMLVACRSTEREPPPQAAIPPTQVAIGQAALAALAAVPWDSDPTGWGSLCSAAAPCDTIVVEPLIVSLPSQAPAFFVPERRDVAATLSPYALTLFHVQGRETKIGAWRECSDRREAPGWTQARVACVAIGVAGLETARPDAVTFALMVRTPAKGLSWPRVRVTRPRESWRGRLLSNAGE